MEISGSERQSIVEAYWNIPHPAREVQGPLLVSVSLAPRDFRPPPSTILLLGGVNAQLAQPLYC